MVIGYLGKDPEIHFLPSGQPVVNFSIATDESFTDMNREKKERVEWHAIVAFSRLGEICAEHLKKGRQVYVEGLLRTREYETKDNSGKRQRTEIVASPVQFLGPRSPEDSVEASPDQVENAADAGSPL